VTNQSKINLEVVGLTSGQTQGSYSLILGEVKGKRKLAIIIGAFEAQAIAIEIEKIIPFRPMTHDLFLNVTNAFDIKVTEIVIYDLKEGVFYAKLLCEREGQLEEIDCRTSDAISLAVRYKCPVYTYDSILNEAGYEFSMEEEDEIEKIEEPETTKENEAEADEFSGYTSEEINTMLDEAIRDEDYSRAALLRDELNKRNPS
jgi:bifunctional DNase/RNase